MRAGVIGVGNLGRVIVEVLLSRGVEVVVHDTNPAAVAGLDDLGATIAADVAGVAGSCDLILVLVQTDAQCEQVVDSVIAAAGPNTSIVLTSTVHPDTVHALGALADAGGVSLVDAPIVGTGVAGILDGTAYALVGGSDEQFARIEPVLAVFTGRVLHTGPRGSAAALKLAHNVVVYLGYLAAVEGEELARLAGVGEGLLRQVTAATGALPTQAELFLDVRCPDPAAVELVASMQNFAAILDKDVRHAAALAVELGGRLPGTELVAGRGAQLFGVPD